MTHTLADGCCSARTPCSHQCKDPSTVCDVCRTASPTVAEWLAEQVAAALDRSNRIDPGNATWHLAQAKAYEAAHAYAAARPDRSPVPAPDASAVAVQSITDDDINWLAREAIRQNNRTLARIAAALLVGRS